MKDILPDNHKKYLERVEVYKNFGYDIEKERKFVLEKSYPLYGDILEVGTGKGYFALELAKEGYRFTSIDISEEEQEFAKANIKYFNFEKLVDFKIKDAESLSFKDESFDIIFSINTIHHLAKPAKVVDELIRIVTFEGKIIISDFSKEGLAVMDRVHASEGRRHQTFQGNLSDIASYLKNKGFKIQEYKSAFQNLIIAHHQTI